MSENQPSESNQPTEYYQSPGFITAIWEKVSSWGIAEPVMRFGAHLLTIALVVVAIVFMRTFYNEVEAEHQADLQATAQAIAAPTVAAAAEELENFGGPFLPGGLPIFPPPRNDLVKRHSSTGSNGNQHPHSRSGRYNLL